MKKRMTVLATFLACVMLFALAAPALAEEPLEPDPEPDYNQTKVVVQDVAFIVEDVDARDWESRPNYKLGQEIVIFAELENNSKTGIVPAGRIDFTLPKGLKLISMETYDYDEDEEQSFDKLVPARFESVIPEDWSGVAILTVKVVDDNGSVTPPNGSPELGDPTNLLASIAMLGIASLSLIATVRATRRKRAALVLCVLVITIILGCASFAFALENLTLEPVTVNHTIRANGKDMVVTAVFTFDNDVTVTGISVEKDAIEIQVGEVAEITPLIVPRNATNRLFTATSDDETVAIVESDVDWLQATSDEVLDIGGSWLPVFILGVEPGTCTVTLETLDGGYTATIDVTVKPGRTITGIVLIEDEIDVEVGEEYWFWDFIVTPSSGFADRRVTAISADPSVATVVLSDGFWSMSDPEITINGISIGTTTITITTVQGGFSTVLTVNVVPEGSRPEYPFKLGPSTASKESTSVAF